MRKRRIAAIPVCFAAACGASSNDQAQSQAPRSAGFATSDVAVCGTPSWVELADFNGDRRLDIATACERDGSVEILLNAGNGQFRKAPGSPFPAGANPNDLAIGDFNEDGVPDLAFANHDTQYLTVLIGDGSGRFSPAAGSPVAVRVRPHPHGIAATDLNGDGHLDLVTDSWGTDQVAIVHGDGHGRFDSPGILVAVGRHPYQRARAADVNGDGDADIVTSNLDGHDLTVLLADGKGAFHQPPGSPFAAGDGPFGLALGDVNGDGHVDAVVVNSPGSTSDQAGIDGVTLLLGDGRGEFRKTAQSPFPTDPRPNRVAIGDLDGDGIADIAVSTPDSDRVAIFLMSKTGAVAAKQLLTIAGGPKGVAIGDLNGDGRPDIAIGRNSGNRLTLLIRQRP